MAYAIVFKSISIIDADHAALWYNKQLIGLGYRFLLHLDETLALIHKNPHAYQVVLDPIRRVSMKKFPYKVFYVVVRDSIIIWVSSQEEQKIYFS